MEIGCRRPEIQQFKRFKSGVLSTLLILVSEWCHRFRTATIFITGMQKGGAVVVGELI